MSLVVYLNSVNSTKFDQPMYTVIHMQDPGSVWVNQDHGSLASRVGSRVTDPVPSLQGTWWCIGLDAVVSCIMWWNLRQFNIKQLDIHKPD